MRICMNSNLRKSLQSLGLIFLILFAMAFACNDEDQDDSERNIGSETQRKTTGEGCSTEQEFKRLLIENFSEVFNERDGKFKETEVIFQSFEIGKSFRYQRSYPEIIDSEPAYPVDASFIKRDYLNGGSSPKILENRVTNYKYVFYINHRGNCVFALENSGKSETEHIPYNR